MSHYQHLSISERECLWESVLKGKTLRKIASELGRSVSTISRELKRNTQKQVYRPSAAQEQYRKRRTRCRRKRILERGELRDTVYSLLTNEQWSPEQIANRLHLEKGESQVSYPTIYRALKAGYMEPKGKRKKNRLGRFPAEKHLRRKGWRGRKRPKKEQFAMKSIDERPKDADLRIRMGHWEGDLVYSRCHKLYVVTMVDRRSRYLLTGITKSRKPAEVAEVIYSMLKDLPTDKLRSVTLDRGKEFGKVTELLPDVEFYFAHPHAPWERGTNENTNGLLRQYVPKNTYKAPFSPELLREFTAKLNNRPRKCLGWGTPSEVFFQVVLHLT